MLVKRTIGAVIILIISFALIFAGGWIYTIGIALILSITVWEFNNLFIKGGYHPNQYVLLFGTFSVILSTYLDNPILISFVYTSTVFLILLSVILQYRRFNKTSAFDLTIEMAAFLFITFLGSYLIKIRFLPNGLFWIMISIIPTGIGDIGAYFVGSILGKHKIAPKLSPNKTIEGYLGGAVAATFTGYALGLIANTYVPVITISASTLIGCITGLISPLGDLSKSIFKRHFNQKNTSNLIPGHGGLLDRLDTSLWAGPIAFFLINFFFL